MQPHVDNLIHIHIWRSAEHSRRARGNAATQLHWGEDTSSQTLRIVPQAQRRLHTCSHDALTQSSSVHACLHAAWHDNPTFQSPTSLLEATVAQLTSLQSHGMNYARPCQTLSCSCCHTLYHRILPHTTLRFACNMCRLSQASIANRHHNAYCSIVAFNNQSQSL